MFLLPQLVEEKSSKVNSTIQVYKFWGNYSLRVDSLTQSGGLLKDIWQKALKSAQGQGLKPKSCLILGLGGGTAAHLVNHLWPQARITGIELDPLMVELGQKYLNLGQVKNLKIITADAFTAIKRLKTNHYQLILVDIYTGQTIPSQTIRPAFFNQLKRLKSSQGMIIFNFLKGISIPDLNQHFSHTRQIKTPANNLILVW